MENGVRRQVRAGVLSDQGGPVLGLCGTAHRTGREAPTSFTLKVVPPARVLGKWTWAFAHGRVPLPTCGTNHITICLYP
jgi:hypothetical protein